MNLNLDAPSRELMNHSHLWGATLIKGITRDPSNRGKMERFWEIAVSFPLRVSRPGDALRPAT